MTAHCFALIEFFGRGGWWAATSRQCFISFYRHKDRNVWSERNMTARGSSQESNTRSRSTFFQARAGEQRLCGRVWTKRLTREFITGSSVCVFLSKVGQFQQLGCQWCTFARALDCKFVYLQTANTCSSVNLSIVNMAKLFWAHRSSICEAWRQIVLNFHWTYCLFRDQ